MFHVYNMNVLCYNGIYGAVRKYINPYVILQGITASLLFESRSNPPLGLVNYQLQSFFISFRKPEPLYRF